MSSPAENPLLATTGIPRFDLIQAEHVVPAVRQVLEHAEEQLKKLEAQVQPTWEGLIVPLEDMDEAFDYAWTPISHLLGVRNSDALRKAHETVLGDMVAFGLKVQQSEAIYQGLKALRNGPTWDQLQPAQQRAVDLKLRDAELSGVGLEDEYKHRFNQINRELSQLSTDFSNHVLDATKAYSLTITDPADTAGWPTTLKQLAAQAHQRANAENKSETPATAETGPWRITLDHPVMGPFLQHSRRRDQREAVYRAFITRAKNPATSKRKGPALGLRFVCPT